MKNGFKILQIPQIKTFRFWIPNQYITRSFRNPSHNLKQYVNVIAPGNFSYAYPSHL